MAALALRLSVKGHDEQQPLENNKNLVVPRMKCYCNALTGRAWRMRYGNIPCDGSICSYQRAEAEKKKPH